jgi:hypothetical protein
MSKPTAREIDSFEKAVAKLVDRAQALVDRSVGTDPGVQLHHARTSLGAAHYSIQQARYLARRRRA